MPTPPTFVSDPSRAQETPTKNDHVYWFAGLGFIAVNLIFIPKAFRHGWVPDRDAAGLLGDFVGGYVGTYFVLLSVLLLYRTLRTQQYGVQFQSFEDKYFELVRLHRDNVSEIKVGKSTGRRVFVLLVRELRTIHRLVRRIAQIEKQNFTRGQLLHLSYYSLYYGVGPRSSRMLYGALSSHFPSAFLAALARELEKEQTTDRGRRRIDDDDGDEEPPTSESRSYGLLDGHQHRLGHYYRHLYQAVRYVDGQKLGITRYDYVKTIRAQLSTHEQALLLVNSLTPLGDAWWRDGLIADYRLVQNVPQQFFDEIEIPIQILFGREYFEWQEELFEGFRYRVDLAHGDTPSVSAEQ